MFTYTQAKADTSVAPVTRLTLQLTPKHDSAAKASIKNEKEVQPAICFP